MLSLIENKTRRCLFMTNAIANDTLEGLPNVGTQVGEFLTNLAPGVGAFIIIMGVFGGVAAIVYAIVGVVKARVRT